MERTEAEIVSQSPLLIRLGDDEYEIKPLTIAKDEIWRKKFATLLGDAMKNATSRIDDVDALNAMLVSQPEVMLESIFAYAPYLPKEKILAEATTVQLGLAFSVIWQQAFQPFFVMAGQLRALANQMSMQIPAKPQSEKHTRLH